MKNSLHSRDDFFSLLACPECNLEAKYCSCGFMDTIFINNESRFLNLIPRYQNKDFDSWQTVRAFDLQWEMYIRNEFEDKSFKYGMTPEEEFKLFLNTLRCTPKDLKNSSILIAGCGIGRVDSYISERCDVKLIVSLDAGESIKFVNNRKNNHYKLQANILNLPFIENVFDFIYSEGVLHHLKHPHDGFKELSRIAKSQGKLGIYVYPQKNNVYRRIRKILPFSWLLPPEFLKLLCKAITMIKKWNVSLDERKTFYFELYDTLCCKYLSTHSPEEVASWYINSGFDILNIKSDLKETLGIKK